MKKRLLLMLAAMMLISVASAAPMMTGEDRTAYLGEESYLYLTQADGVPLVLRLPVGDVLAVTADGVYARSQQGQLLRITLDGTASEVIETLPEGVPAVERYLIDQGRLSLVRTDGTEVFVASDVFAAAIHANRLYYAQKLLDGVQLISLEITGLDSMALAPIPTYMYTTQLPPISLTASADAVTMVLEDRSVLVIRQNAAIQPAVTLLPAVSEQTAVAYAVGTTVIRCTVDAQGLYHVEDVRELPLEPMAVAPTKSVIPTVAPTQTPYVIATSKPTATPRISFNDTEEELYPELAYGDTGSAVRKLQRRLKDLGYPVGSVDGDWGKNTQLAVNLFQNAAGYKERSYITSAAQEKLYSSKAPKYDKYKPLQEGKQGTPVQLMQQALFDLGYFGHDYGEVDGYYGPKTAAAVKAFQQEIVDSVEPFDDSITPTGKADRATLKVLFGTMAPMAPTGKPSNTPPLVELITPPPSGGETDKPSDDLVEVITPPSSGEETDKPSDDLVEVITPPSNGEPSDPPEPTDDGGVELIVPGGN